MRCCWHVCAPGSSSRGGLSALHGRRAASPWSRRNGPLPRRPVRDVQHETGHRRPWRRRRTAFERGRSVLGDAERRDLQLRRVAGRAKELGHRFSTSCDTEVIAHAYEEWGTGCLERFNGDFAIALWDRERREVFLARDRFGVRPLFVSEFGGDFSFASEAKALHRHPAASRELDPLALVETFTIWSVLPDRSAFVGVRELPPAHYLLLGPDGIVVERRWWDLPFPPAGEAGAASGDEHEELLELLRDATRLRLRADVPVGAYISGGLDSSATAALASRLAPSLSSYGIGFHDQRFDESVYQDRLAEEPARASRGLPSAQRISENFYRAPSSSRRSRHFVRRRRRSCGCPLSSTRPA